MAEFTEAMIAKTKARAQQERRTIEISDKASKGGSKAVPGLRMRASYGGSASFFLIYRSRVDGRSKRMLIGKHPGMTISDARKRAIALRGEIAQGHDPIEDQREQWASRERKRLEAEEEARALAERMTVRELAERFLSAKAELRWEKRYRQMLTYNLIDPPLEEMQFGIGDKAADDLTAQDIEQILDGIGRRGSGVQKRRVFEVLRAMIRWARTKKLIAHDPLDGVETPNNSKPRERVLSVSELQGVWNTLRSWEEQWLIRTGDHPPAPLSIVRILTLQLLLGQRSGEISGMRKHELSADGFEWTIPGERTKNGRQHTVPLPPLAREIITAAVRASDHKSIVFQAHARGGKGYNPVRSDVISSHVENIQPTFGFRDHDDNPNPFVAHDLRRSVATYLRKLGIGQDIVALILNHVSEKSSTVTGKHYDYSAHEYAKREALTRWQATLQRIADGSDPFARSAEDVTEMERRIIGRAAAPQLVVIERSA